MHEISYDRNVSLALSFIDAFNRRDLDDFLTLLADDVELRTMRGTKRGRREAARWFEKPFDHLDLSIEPERLIAYEDCVVISVVMRFTWTEGGELADESRGSGVWTICQGRIQSWQPFPDLPEAIGAAGILPSPQ